MRVVGFFALLICVAAVSVYEELSVVDAECGLYGRFVFGWFEASS